MEEDDTIRPGSPEALLLAEDLSLLGLEELQNRKKNLQSEISRIEKMLESKQGSRNDAEALFSKP